MIVITFLTRAITELCTESLGKHHDDGANELKTEGNVTVLGVPFTKRRNGKCNEAYYRTFFYASETVLTYFFYETFIMGKSKRVITQMESGYVMQLTETCRKEI